MGEATSSLSETYNRLSSGLRITKASDDAAGLAVSSLLNADKRVTNQAIRNLNDGVSYLNVAEGALGELTNIVTRIRELAEQSANGTLGNSQRVALQKEVTSLQDEYNRIVTSTKFNGKQILTGEDTNTILQGGYGTNAQLGIQVGDASLGIENDITRAGLTTRLDTDSSGVVGNGFATAVVISADGRYVAFDSEATNLVAGDTNGFRDTFIKDTVTGGISRIGTDSSGGQGNFISEISAISSDGRYVAFNSTSTNLVTGDTNGVQDSFIKDTLTGVTTRISTDSSGDQANSNSNVFAISTDGRYVAFNSNATNLVAGDTNGVQDSFIKDMLTGVTTRVSTDSLGVQGNSTSSVASISADGRYVAFYSNATNLVAGDTNGASDIFIKDMETGVTTRVSTDSSGVQGNGHSTGVAISADGRYVAFNSNATNLVAGDTNGAPDTFIKDTLTGITTMINTDSSGVQGDDESFIVGLSADGRYVAFSSFATNLDAGDTNGTLSFFRKDTLTGITTLISLDNLGGQGGSEQSGGGISADGNYGVFLDDSGEVFLRDLSTTGIQQISGMVVSNQASAKVTLDLAKRYQEEISSYMAGIGAGISRATTFMSTLQTASENYASAASQITDVDVAEETARLASTSILQRAASSVLAQANQQPSLALRLLRE